MATWRDFTDAVVRRNDIKTSSVVNAARTWNGICSSGERAVLCAVLAAADFAWLADELGGSENWQRFRGLGSDYREAIAAAILRRDAA